MEWDQPGYHRALIPLLLNLQPVKEAGRRPLHSQRGNVDLHHGGGWDSDHPHTQQVGGEKSQRQSEGCYQEQGSSRDRHPPATARAPQTHRTHPNRPQPGPELQGTHSTYMGVDEDVLNPSTRSSRSPSSSKAGLQKTFCGKRNRKKSFRNSFTVLNKSESAERTEPLGGGGGRTGEREMGSKSDHVLPLQGGMEGSVLTYHCGPDQYPFPVSSRLCGDDWEWSVMRSNNGRQISRAICKDILCPAQLQLDHGDFWPRDQWARVGTTQTFSCQEGFTLYGSAQRNCTMSGEWTGTTPICDNHADDCSNPGIPPGAQRSEGRFQTGEKVIYRCQAGLDLLGSAERECLENREWSGSTPRCQGTHMFDSPSVVAAAMAGSLAGVMDVISPDSKKTG
ncbi:hypothetical protein F7725_020914 [Dissostichus mawsoni]|uniref:Sushi domain-containing protein n=1 Tax=Dissostichus mawsoni TaxID=36200 RepID=A0A7J5YEJ0_DISMA|nr:hypothetical protein F7725_020914 [Dissostichus mawsoni]